MSKKTVILFALVRNIYAALGTMYSERTQANYVTGRNKIYTAWARSSHTTLDVGRDEGSSRAGVNGIRNVLRKDEEALVANIITIVADDLNLVLINVADSCVGHRVTKDNNSADLAHVRSEVVGGVVNGVTTLRVTR